VSTGVGVSVLGPRRWAVASDAPARRTERGIVRVSTFAALALFGVFRWSGLMSPAPTWRLLGLLGLSVALAGLGTALAGRHRWLVVAAAVVAVIAIFPIAGIPLAWVRHVRLEVGATAIGQGLSALPNALVPYLGINHWVRVVVVLGAGVLLLDAALLVAFAPRALGDARRAGAALPLVALAIVPTTLIKPELPYLQGLILFGLLAAFMWAERAPMRDAATAIAVVGLAGLGAIIAAPRIDPHHSWINYEALAEKLAIGHVDTFNWQQGYGPLKWPTRGDPVLDVQATHPDYWKAENLEVFEDQGWTTGNLGPPPPTDTVSASALKRWTQRIQVTVRGMRTIDVIAAGVASKPTDVAQGVLPGISPGTWTAGAPLQPGNSYRVTTYAPEPTAAELAAAGTDYPAALLPKYLSILVPEIGRSSGLVSLQAAVFPPFGTSQAEAHGLTNTAPGPVLKRSPYAQALGLAQRLKRGAGTPYAYAEAIMKYLGHGYTYDQNVPAVRDPLEAFLFRTKRGYCQQFAGAMALLLRMGGVPARVSVGFTSGTYDSATHEWIVDDTDAHAWVEAWFPSYGWVRFDPTPPAAAPATASKLSDRSATDGAGSSPTNGRGLGVGKTAVSGLGQRVGTSLPVGLAIAALAIVLCLIAIAFGAWRRAVVRAGEDPVQELERALRRSGRPIGDGVTLVALERRFESSAGAAGYVRTIRLARYGGAGARPTREQRRALRRALAVGLGAGGHLRALWALPPRR
jgi:transglutaminase-like putative cysteine protease